MLTIVAGWAVVVWPNRSLFMFSVIVGAALLGTAIMELWLSITTRDGKASARILGIVVGLSLLAAGVLCLHGSMLTITVLTLVLALSCLVGSVVEIHRAVTGEDDRLAAAVGGVVILLAGIVVLTFPLEGAVATVWLLGAGLATAGVVALARGMRARSAASAR